MSKSKDRFKNIPIKQKDITRNPSVRDGITPAGVMHQTAIVEEYRGPIPSAGELKRYEDILPGAADRILTMAENQAAHRQKLEAEAITANIKNSRRGQAFAFIISMAVVVVGFILIMCDKNGWGLSMILADLAILAAVFVGNRVSEARELSRKRHSDGQRDE